MTRIAVLISGRGSNMRAIVDACKSNKLSAEVVAVFSNNPEAKGLEYAQANNIATKVVDHTRFSQREDFDKELQLQLHAFNPDWVVLAGFMRILTPSFVKHYSGKLVNIHPSLLPSYPGLNTHARVLDAGEKQHGASVHFVIPELDAGPVIAQRHVSVEPDDTEHTLAERVLGIEHALYIEALQLCVNGQARL